MRVAPIRGGTIVTCPVCTSSKSAFVASSSLLPDFSTISGTVGNGDITLFTENVDAGTARLEFLLKWDHDWAHYPTSDLDLIVCSPAIPSTVADCRAFGDKRAATLASPERVTIENPAGGTWTFLIHGFNIFHGSPENFTLEIRH